MTGKRRLCRMIASLAVALTFTAAPAASQQVSPATLGAARELVELRGAANMFDSIVGGVVEQGMGLLMQTNPGLAKDLQDVSVIIRKDLAPRRGELVGEVAKIYAQRFNEAELKEALAFYKTPVGRKLLAEEPMILDQSFALMQQWASRLSEQVLDRYRAEMKKRGHTL